MHSRAKPKRSQNNLRVLPSSPQMEQNQNLIKPSYYTDVRYQVIDVCEDWGLDFLLGNVLKYIQRAGRKPGSPYVEDLKKAQTYLNLKLDMLEGRRGTITHERTPDRERNDPYTGRVRGGQKGS